MKVNNLEFNIGKMDTVHSKRETEFLPILQETYPHATVAETLDNRQLLFVDNGKSTLGIAHLDGTMPAQHFFFGRRRNRPGDIIIMSPFVDDRLGAYTLIDLLPQVGIECDLLFTVGEEMGMSTGEDFTPPRQYNWMFQFDRMGTDVVHYQYRNDNWLTAIEKHFPEVERGLASDISKMSHMQCQGMNIGTGYHDYTGYNAWASLLELSGMVHKFKKFYDEFKDTPFLTAEGKPRAAGSEWEEYFRPSVSRSRRAIKAKINLDDK